MLRFPRHAYMNWQQRFHAATPDERDQVAIFFLKHIGKKQNRWIFINGAFIRERRRRYKPYHLIGERRVLPLPWRQVYKLFFAMIMLTVSVATWLIALHIPMDVTAAMVFLYDILIITFIIRKPYRQTQTA